MAGPANALRLRRERAKSLALVAQRHMHKYGTRREAFAEVVMASRAYAQTMDSGPIAFVMRTTEARQIIDRYINLAQANRPAGVFFTVEDAQEWLAKQRR